MREFSGAILFCLTLWIPGSAHAFPPPDTRTEPGARGKPLIQIALILDTSSSMQGLLNQAKTQLWSVVNELALAKKGGVRPDFHVALYEYGNKTLPSSTGYLRQVTPLTDNLDKVSEELLSLNIRGVGNEEYAGWAIRAALDELAWSPSSGDLKIILIAGNESFAQGPVDYRTVCAKSIARGILVDTIFCGPKSEGIRLHWQDGANRGEGMYTNIDQNRVVRRISTPQDEELLRLGAELNDTYIPFGDRGNEGKQRQEAVDREASANRATEVDRVISKGTSFYRNPSWDLVDAVRDKKVRLEDIKNEDLPEMLRKMSLDERKHYVEEMTRKRATIRAEIAALGRARDKEAVRLSSAERTRESKKSQQALEPHRRQDPNSPATAKDEAPAGAQASTGVPSPDREQDSLGSATIKMLREHAKQKKFEFESGDEKKRKSTGGRPRLREF